MNCTYLIRTHILCTRIGTINCRLIAVLFVRPTGGGHLQLYFSRTEWPVCINLICAFAAITFLLTRPSLWTNFLTKSGMTVVLPFPSLIWSCLLWLLSTRPSGKGHETKTVYSRCCGEDKNRGDADGRRGRQIQNKNVL